MSPSSQLTTSDDLLICTACGTQFPVTEDSGKSSCRICDDPRQFVPPTGQTFTTLAKLREDGYKNVWKQDEYNPKLWNVWTETKFAIGERAILLQTPHGNILWDLITLLDQETVDKINSLGGLAAMVISHPHYYTTYADWSRTFSCPVYIAQADSQWLERTDTPGLNLQLFNEQHKEIVPGVTAIICGGHFDGSIVLHWERTLFIADTILTVPSGKNPTPPPPSSSSITSFSFMYSIPNWIPLNPSAIHGIWKAIQDPKYDFDTTMGAFVGMDVRSKGPDDHVKRRVLDSMKIVVRSMGWEGHAIMEEHV